MSKIFVSYSRKNSELVHALANDIDAMGHEVWIDNELSGGQIWWDEIIENIQDTEIFILAVSPASLESVACTREYQYAAALGKLILPVLVEEGVSTNLLSPELSRIHLIDFRSGSREALIYLVKAIGKNLEPAPLPSPLPSPPQVPISYLAELGQRVNDVSSLSHAEQSALVFEIKASLDNDETHSDGMLLLEKMQRRKDLLATIAKEIEQISAKTTAVKELPKTTAVKEPPKTTAVKEPATSTGMKLWTKIVLIAFLVFVAAKIISPYVFVIEEPDPIYCAMSSPVFGTNYEGDDIRYLPDITTADYCSFLCDIADLCMAWVWTTPSYQQGRANECQIKRAKSVETRMDDVVSGYKVCSTDPAILVPPLPTATGQ